jgi:hypothetical protein
VYTRIFHERPSPLAYMARALLPSRRVGRPPTIPPLRLVWRNAQIDAAGLSAFHDLTGLPAEPAPSLLLPHVFGFPLLMVLLTERAFPMPIWNALQVRNQLHQHAVFNPADRFDIETTVAGSRVLVKGLEVDLHTSFAAHGALVWESAVTFYYRGAFGIAAQGSTPGPPATEGGEVARWRATTGQGLRFGALTGDYNPIHWSNAYARAFGFRRAFHHPPRVLGQALAHLPIRVTEAKQRLDVWLRGQVYEKSVVRLHASGSTPLTFAVIPQDDPRPAIIARWSADPGD